MQTKRKSFWNHRFVFSSPAELTEYQEELMYIDDITPTRDEWPMAYKLWDKCAAVVKYPIHLKEWSAIFHDQWTEYQQEKWKKKWEAKKC